MNRDEMAPADRWLKGRIIAIVIAFVVVVVDYFSNEHHSVASAFTIVILFAVLEQAIELRDLLNRRFIADKNELTHKVKAFCKIHKGTHTARLVSRLETLQRKTTVAVDLDKHLVEVTNPELGSAVAISTYRDFWRFLVEKQEALKGKQSLKVRAIHGTPIKVWTKQNQLVQEILRLQEDFVDGGGTVTRILIDWEGTDASRLRYYEVRESMRNKKIDARYLHPSPDFDETLNNWDFLVAGTGVYGQDETVIWKEVDRQGLPQRAIYSPFPSYEDNDLDALWSKCWSELQDYERLSRGPSSVIT